MQMAQNTRGSAERDQGGAITRACASVHLGGIRVLSVMNGRLKGICDFLCILVKAYFPISLSLGF